MHKQRDVHILDAEELDILIEMADVYLAELDVQRILCRQELVINGKTTRERAKIARRLKMAAFKVLEEQEQKDKEILSAANN